MTPEERIEKALHWLSRSTIHDLTSGAYNELVTLLDDGRPRVGDHAVLLVEGTVVKLEKHYFTMQPDDGSEKWTVEYDEPHWTITRD